MSGENIVIGHTSSVIYAKLEGSVEKAYLKYTVDNGVMKLVSTYTPPQFRGRGIAARLVEYAIELARRNGWKIQPICSYTIHYFIKNKDKRDILIEEYQNLTDEEWKRLLEEALKSERQGT